MWLLFLATPLALWLVLLRMLSLLPFARLLLPPLLLLLLRLVPVATLRLRGRAACCCFAEDEDEDEEEEEELWWKWSREPVAEKAGERESACAEGEGPGRCFSSQSRFSSS